jgi:hypothetical protein
VKKKQTIYIDEKFIRKFGMENKTQIVNDALKKYYTEERENLKNDLQVIKEFTEAINNLNTRIYQQQIEIEKIKERLDLNFNMSIFCAYSTDVILDEKNKRIITGEIEEIKKEYKKIKPLIVKEEKRDE